MSITQFKFIWYMEFIHRMWGRTIGAAFVFPAIYFFYRGYFSSVMKSRVFIYGGLIGFQVVIYLLPCYYMIWKISELCCAYKHVLLVGFS